MIDIQYLSVPLNKNINSVEGNEVKWVDIRALEDMRDVDDEIKVKVLSLYKHVFLPLSEIATTYMSNPNIFFRFL